MTKPRLYLHIGYHKTGSTSLQSSLGENRALLREHGVFYPENSGKRPYKHTFLSAATGKLSHAGPADPNALRAVLAPIAEGAEGCDITVLSDEAFSTAPPRQVQALAQLQADFDVRVVAVVRRQDAFLLSWYHQVIKERRHTQTFPNFVRKMPWRRLYYAKALKIWAQAFGPQALRVLSFDRANEAPGRIHRALIDVTTEGRLTATLPERRWNRSFPSVMFELKRQMALGGDLPASSDAYMEALRHLRTRRGKALRHPVFAKSYLTEGLRSEILERFEADNRTLQETYCGGEDPFPGFNRSEIPLAQDDGKPVFTQAELALAALEMVRIQSKP